MRKWVWPIVGLIGVLIFLLLSRVADPQAQVDLNTTRNESLVLSRQWLSTQGFDLTGYEGAVSFESDQNALIYLQRNYSLAESNQLSRDYKVWHWSVRWFKPGEQTEYNVTVDTAQPKVLGFSRTYPETSAGASLSAADALAAAQRFLERNGYPLSQWELVGSRSKQQRARTDYHFEWQQKNVTLKGAFPKVDVDVQGDQVSGLQHYLLVPAQFQRTYSQSSSVGDALAIISLILMMGLWALALGWSIRLARNAAWGLGIWGSLLLVGVSLAGALNGLSLLKSQMPTYLPPAFSYVVAFFMGLLPAFLSGVGILFPAAAGQGLLQQMGRDGAPSFNRVRQGALLSTGFARSSLRGLAVAGVMLGYDTLFYFVGRQYLGVWSPAAPSYSDILATPAPWLYPLTVGISAAFMEEYTFRLFGTAVAKRWLKWTPAALVLPAAIWAFAHSNYPVFPVWTRGVELTIMGTFLGWVFWRYDIETTVVAHYTYDALLVGWPLLLSGNTYYVAAGALVTGLALLPALVGWIMLLRSRRATAPVEAAAPLPPAHSVDPVDAVPPVDETEAALPASPPARPEIAGRFLHKLLSGIKRQPIPWVAAGFCGLLSAALLAGTVFPTLAPQYKVTEAQAEQTARSWLTDRGVALDGFQVARQMSSQTFVTYAESVSPAYAEAVSQDYAGVRWSIRFYQPLNPVSYLVEIDLRSGAVVGYSRTLPSDRPGSRIGQETARGCAEAFLRSRGIEPSSLTLADASALSRDQREDYHFVWESHDPRLPETRVRREVTVQGDEVGQFEAPYPYVPEAWTRQQDARSGWLMLGGLLLVLSGIAGLVMAIIYLVRGQASWKTTGRLALVVALLTLPSVVPQWSGMAMNYSTQTVWFSFLVTMLVGLLFVPFLSGAGVGALHAVGTVVARETPPPLTIGQTALGALTVAGLSTGLTSLLRWLGTPIVPPATATPNVAGSYLSLLGLFAIPLTVLFQEYLLRLWFQSLASRWLRSRLLGILAQAVLVGVMAAFSLQPGFWYQGLVALIASGIVYGVAYQVGGLRLVISSGICQALFQQGLLLYGAGIRPAAVNGSVALVLALVVPVAIWLWQRRRGDQPL